MTTMTTPGAALQRGGRFSRAALLPALAALILVAACATPTPYQAATPETSTGYQAQRIESDRFRVSFRGNSATSRQIVDTYMFYRCAEITLQNGKDYFVVVNKDVDKSTRYETYGSTLAWGWAGGWGWRHRPVMPAGWAPDAGYARPISNYEAIADIVLRSGVKPAEDADAYDAREVLAAIGQTVLRIAPAPGTPLAVSQSEKPAG